MGKRKKKLEIYESMRIIVTMEMKKHVMGKYPLWLQTASLFTLIATLVIAILTANNYIYDKNALIESHVTQSNEILDLKMDTITQYIKELTSFAIQPCYDSRFMRIIESKREPNADDIDFIKNRMKEYYYTRSDLNSYKIYLSKDKLTIGRDRGEQHLSTWHQIELSTKDQKAFNECSSSKYFLAISPSDNKNDFFTFYHSIIQIDNKSSLAYVKCDIDTDFLSTLTKGHQNDSIYLLYNSDGKLLYSEKPEIYQPDLAAFNFNSEDKYVTKQIKDEKYIAICRQNNPYGFTLVSLQPYSYISDKLKKVFLSSTSQGIVVWAISVFIIYLLCRRLMSPLNRLAKELKKVGEGDFSSRVDIGGSQEIENLGTSFNYMSEHIQTLINENYLVTLNEQASRLIALEAQINPHFLYNTLQAISTEALVNDQEQIHQMVISLASILRYSIKGGDWVTLADEMAHVNKYIYLQKIRMDDNLQTSVDIENEAYPCLIPKISIQTLVENCVIHGINGDITAIEIKIEAFINNNYLHIIVKDNGCGMDEKTLSNLMKNFGTDNISSTQTQGVGLANLHERLNILYHNESEMTVQSKINQGTIVHITLPVKRGINEQGINN